MAEKRSKECQAYLSLIGKNPGERCDWCPFTYDSSLKRDSGCLLTNRKLFWERVQENNTPEELLEKLKDARAFLLDVSMDDLKRVKK